VALRSWLVIPCGGCVATAIAFGAGRTETVALTVGLAAAAITACVRVLAGHSPASLVGGLAAAAIVGVGVGEPRAAVALALAGFAIVELMRETRERSIVPPIAAAFLAAILDPTFVALAPVVGSRLRGARWTILAPVLGVAVVAVATIASLSWPGLWRVWSGHRMAAGSPDHAALAVAETLGAVITVASVLGLALVPRRALVVVAIATTAVLVDARTGHVGASGIGIAALAAGLSISRLGATIRIPAGQACAAGAAGFIAVASLAVQAL